MQNLSSLEHGYSFVMKNTEYQDFFINNMIGAAPERADEIQYLWNRYHPSVVVVNNKKVTINANKSRIEIDIKTTEVFWLIGFCGWRAIETYMPDVIMASCTNQPIKQVIQNDDGINECERNYKERIKAVHDFIKKSCGDQLPWPPDIPKPSADRNELIDRQHQAAYDLVGSAVAFILFHEFYHVILDYDNKRPAELPEEELACDVWAREFLTANIAQYAESKNLSYQIVLKRRSMAFVIAALIIHEITPIWEHGGNSSYFSVAIRMKSIILDTRLPDDDDFWNFSAAVLIGMCRQKHIPFDPLAMNSKNLVVHLLELL